VLIRGAIAFGGVATLRSTEVGSFEPLPRREYAGKRNSQQVTNMLFFIFFIFLFYELYNGRRLDAAAGGMTTSGLVLFLIVVVAGIKR
jgi:hypothetical protein